MEPGAPALVGGLGDGKPPEESLGADDPGRGPAAEPTVLEEPLGGAGGLNVPGGELDSLLTPSLPTDVPAESIQKSLEATGDPQELSESPVSPSIFPSPGSPRDAPKRTRSLQLKGASAAPDRKGKGRGVKGPKAPGAKSPRPPKAPGDKSPRP